MWLDLHGAGLAVGAAERERVERRLGFALARHGDHIGRVTAHLVDLNGPRGGADKRCRLVVEVLGHGRVVVEDTDASLAAAIDRAADRAGQAVRRRLDGARQRAPRVDPRSAPGRG